MFQDRRKSWALIRTQDPRNAPSARKYPQKFSPLRDENPPKIPPKFNYDRIKLMLAFSPPQARKFRVLARPLSIFPLILLLFGTQNLGGYMYFGYFLVPKFSAGYFSYPNSPRGIFSYPKSRRLTDLGNFSYPFG